MLLRCLLQRVFGWLFAVVLRLFLGIARILGRVSDQDIADLKEMNAAQDPPPADGAVTLLVPIGQVPLSVLYAARDVLFESFVHTVEVVEPIPIPEEEAYNKRRRQYNVCRLAKAVEGYIRPDTFRAIGIVDADVYFPGLNFVFGSRVPGSRAIVIGLKRLRPPEWVSQWGEDEEWKELIKRRVGVLVVSQIASSLGLGACESPGCARMAVNSLPELDRKSATLCPTCAAQISEWLKGSGETASVCQEVEV
jgi:archaemetzincin